MSSPSTHSSSPSSSSSRHLSRMSLLSASVLLFLSLSLSLFTPSSAQTVPELRSGVSQPFRALTAGTWTYFSFTNQVAAADVVLGLTALSGNPDIFYNRGDNGVCVNPTASSYTGKDDRDGGGVVSEAAVPIGAKFCIGVYAAGGFVATGRVLVFASNDATATANAITLNSGEPVNDVLRGGSYRYYTFFVPSPPPASVSISVTQRSDSPGDPDLFVNHPDNGTFPRSGRAWLSANNGNNGGDDILTITAPKSGTYYISVLAFGFNAAQYQLIAVSSNGRQELADGVAYPMALPMGAYAYYTFTVPADTDVASRTLLISATPTTLVMELSVYCSYTNQNPTREAGQYQFSSATQGADVVVISGARGQLRAGTVYCGVYADSEVRFHVMAQFRAKTALENGRTMREYVPAQTGVYFTFDIPAAIPTNWTVSTQAAFGQHRLYVSAANGEEPNHLNASTYIVGPNGQGNGNRGQSVRVPADACPPDSSPDARCRFTILVWALQDTSFDIIATTLGTPRELRNGQVVYGYSAANSYEYFSFRVADPRSNVTIVLTSTDGDPNLYVSFLSYHPTTTDNDMRAESAEGEVLYFDWTTDVIRAGKNGDMTGTYYIAVYGRTPALWNLRVKIIDAANPYGALQLTNGIPVQSTLMYGMYDYYSFIITAADWPNTVVITMQPFSGDPDLYVSNRTGLIIWNDNSTYQFSSEMSEGNTDELTFYPQSAASCNPTREPSGVCTYHIAVHGWHDSVANVYSIVAHTGNVNVLLANGSPFEHSLRAGQAEYYSFYNSHPGGTVVVMITPIQGDPGLHVSSTVPRPNATNYQYASNAAGGDLIVIRNASANAYFVGVNSVDRQPARYTILALSYDPQSLNLNPIALTNGRSVPGFADYQEYRHYYYTLRNTNVTKLTVFVEKKLGDPDVYVNHPDNGTYPEADDSTAYRFEHEDGSDVLVIRNPYNERAPIDTGTWRMSVYSPNIRFGEREASQYLLTVVEGGTTLQLSDGVQMQSRLLLNEYDYFSFYVLPQTNTTGNSLVISVTTFGGDVDVSCDDVIERPLWTQGKWYSLNTDGSDGVVISNPRPGTTYYCGVHGYRPSHFSIVASLSAPVQLQAGSPFHMQQPVGGTQYYLFETSYAQRQSLTINVRPTQGRAFVYVANGTMMPNFADRTTWQLGNSQIEYDGTQSIRLTNASCTLAAGADPSLARCRYNILVYVPSNGLRWDAVYSITVETENDATTLERGGSVEAYLMAGQTKYYKFYISEERVQWSLQMTTEFGDPDVYVSRVHTVPGPPDDREWQAAEPGQDVLTVDWNDPLYAGGQSMAGTYYVAVQAYAPEGDVFFRLVLITESEDGRSQPLTLVQGVAQTRSLPAGVFAQYRFQPSGEGWPYGVMITVIPLAGDPDLYVSRNEWPTNSSASAMFSSTNDVGQADVVWINTTNANVCNPTVFTIGGSSCWYGILVYSYSATHYQILVTTMNANGSTTPILLSNGLTQRGVVVRNNYAYYYHLISKLGNTVVVSVSPITGNPDIYASFNQTAPTMTNYQYRSNSASGDMIVVRNATQRFIQIGVHAAGFQSRSDFYITASSYDPSNTKLSSIALQNGVQVVDFGARDDYKYFRYELTEQVERLTFGITMRMGDADLFIDYGRNADGVPNWPSDTVAQWYSNSFDGAYDIRSIYDPQPGEYFIAVHAFTDTGFAIMATRSGTPQQMVNGVVYPGQLRPDMYAFYQFVVSPAEAPFTSKTLLFSLSTLSTTQDPDLYCSDTVQQPTHLTPGVNASTSVPPYDMIRYSGQEGQLHAGTYYCGVRAYPSTSVDEVTYIFSAYLNDRTALEDGVPTYDSVMPGEVKYYTFTQTNGPNASDVIVTTQVNEGQGVAWLYINKAVDGDPDIDDPNQPAEWYSMIGNGWRHQSITLWWDQCYYSATPCTYNIAVYSPAGAGSSSYTIVAASGDSHQTLEPGVLLQQEISTQTSSRYYQFEVTDPRTNVTIVLDSGANDLDLYVSRQNYYPTAGSIEGWQYGQPTGERAFITPADPYFGTGTWYVTVYGYHPSSFTIRLTLDVPGEPNIVRLNDGEPVRDSGNAGQWRWYEYMPPVNGWPYTVYFTLTPLVGDSDLVVRVTDGYYPLTQTLSQPVTSTTWRWGAGAGGTDVDQLSVAATVPDNCRPNRNSTVGNGTRCSYTIGVRAYVNAAQWYVVASTSKSLLEVRNGVTLGPKTLNNNQWDYYFLREVNQPGMTVTLSLVSLRGNPDMYVSTTTAYPNMTHSQWRSTGDSHDMVTIPNAAATIYYIAVHAAGGGTNEYTLTARVFNASNPTASVFPLSAEGVAYPDSLSAMTYRYWSFYLNTDEPSEYVTFTVRALMGDPDLYINYALDPVVFPTTSASQWSKLDDGDDIITIAQPANGRYIVGVYVKVDTFYTLTVTTAGSMQAVAAGQVYSGVLLAGQNNYYRYALLNYNPNTQLSFSVSLEYGNPDLYVSDRAPRPNASSAVWSSTTTGSDVVTITNTSAIHTGNWYATVHAVTDVSYYFIVSYGGVNTLTDCTTVNFNVGANLQSRYQVTVPGSLMGDTTDTTISLQMNSGAVGVYISVGATAPQLGQPNTYFLAVSPQQAAENPNVRLTVPRARCFNVTSCVINVLMWNPNQAGTSASGSIIATTGRCAVTLQAGVSYSDTIGEAGERNMVTYRFRVPSNFANVSVRLTMTNNGNADLFCSVTNPRPGYSTNDWSSQSEGTDDLVYFDWTDPKLAGIRMAERTFYCGVMRPENSPFLYTTYNILYTYIDASGQNYNLIPLTDGMPQQFNLPQETYMYFTYKPSPIGYPYDIYIQLTALDVNGVSDPDMFVRNDGQLPTSGYSFWEATGDSTTDASKVELLVIPAEQGRACSRAAVLLENCTYIIGVHAWGYPAVFQILIDTSNPNTYTQLTNGNAVQGVAAPNTWHYYSFAVSGGFAGNGTWNSTLTTLALQSISGGSPQLYIGLGSRPNMTYSIASTATPGSSVLQWSARPGRYIAGVYNGNATSASNYYLTEYIGPIPLQNGQSFEDTLMAGEQRRYSFHYTSGDRNSLTIDVAGASAGQRFEGLVVYVRVGTEWSALTQDSYQYMRDAFGLFAATITIAPSDAYYTNDGTYQILVVAGRMARFTISASDGTVPVAIVNGQSSFVGAAPVGDYRYFRGLATSAQGDLVINVVVVAGAVSVYASATDRNPSSLGNNYTVSSQSGFGGAKGISIVIPRGHIRAGYYYFSVRTDGTVPATYVVQMTTTQVQMYQTISQEAQCSQPPRYYSLGVNQPNQDVHFIVSPSDWQSAAYTGRFLVYVSRSAPFPTATNYQWTGGNALSMSQDFLIPKEDTQLRACISEGQRTGVQCTLYIAVACQPPTANVSYLFTATVGKSAVPLVDGAKREVALAHGQSDYYVSYVQNARTVWLLAEPCRGQVRLDVSTSNAQPRPQQPGQWVANRPNTYQSLAITNSSAFTGIYYAGVRAMEANTVYRLVQMTMNDSVSANVVALATPRVAASTELRVWRDDANVHVTFARATIPTLYRSNSEWRYTMRYTLFLAPEESAWLMYTECGLNHTQSMARMADIDLEDSAETGDLSFDASLMNNTDDAAATYKLNVLAQIWQQPARGVSTPRPIQWTAYTSVSNVKLDDLPLMGPGGAGFGPGERTSLVSGPMVALYILLPIAFFIALIGGHFWYKRKSRAPPIPLDIFNETSGETYKKHTDDDDTNGVYTNGNGSTNGATNGKHEKGANGTNGASHYDEYENEKKEAPAGSVELGDANYVANPTATNNFYTQ